MVLVVKNPPAIVGEVRHEDLVPGVGKYPDLGHGNPLQYSCLKNSTDREAWQAMVRGVTDWNTTERISFSH